MSGDAVARRLIERHRLEPENAGEIARLVALTHNLEPGFFDDDLLPNVLGLSQADDRSYAASVELQRKLQGISCRVLMESSAYVGRPSLRTEVRPVSLPAGRLHAKYFAAEYERAVLMSIGSANLTSNGFRKNREVAGVLVTHENGIGDAALMLETVSGALRTLQRISEPWMPPVLADLEAIRDKVLSWHPQPAEPTHGIVWSNSEQRLLDTIVSAWASESRVHRVDIVSPFWSEDGHSPSPLRALLESLHSAGIIGDRVDVHLYFDAHALEGGGYTPAFPSRFQVHYADMPRVQAFAHAIDPTVDASELDVRVDIYSHRPLHAKVLRLESDTHALAYAGSANFTRNGMGVGRTGNIEAGWLLRGHPRELDALIPPEIGEPEALHSGTISPEVAGEEDKPTLYFPDFLLDVNLETDEAKVDQLKLRVKWSDSAPKHFQLRTVCQGEEVPARAGETLLVVTGAGANSAVVPVACEALRALLSAREVWVHNHDLDLQGPYPVNVAVETRLLLPIADGAPRPGEAALIAYYQGQISFEGLYPDPGSECALGQRSLDALERSGVDTTRIQSYRVRAFVEALPGLFAELCRVRGPRAVLEMAFLSETSPVGLARCIAEEVTTGRKSATAGGFQLVEILRVVREAARSVGERDPMHLKDVARLAQSRISELLAKLQASHPEAFGSSDAFARFQDAVLNGSRA